MMKSQGRFIAHETFLEHRSKTKMERSPRQLIPGHVVDRVHPIQMHANAFILAATVNILIKTEQQ